jgi:two-component system, NarL family, sensor histidine kinase DesK
MFVHMFKARPGSIVEIVSRNASGSRESRWYPLLMLVWTFWIVATPYFDRDKESVLAPTLVSLAIFLYLYYAAHFLHRRYLPWCVAGIASLAFALAPINAGAQGYIIYACAFLGFCGPARPMVQLMVLLVVTYAAVALLLGHPWLYPLSTALIGLVVGLMNIVYRRNVEVNADLKLSHDEVRRLAATAERERIGRDLHDLLGHTLSLIALKSELANRLWDIDPAAARREVREVERVTRDALAQVRRAVTGIRAAGLAAELASARLLLESAGVVFDYDVPPVTLDPDIETCLALALREAVTNIQRHARAGHATVTLRQDDARVELVIRDDGRGGDIVPGNGLLGMRERLAAVGATLAIDSVDARGTALTIRVACAGDAAASTTGPALRRSA